MSLLFHIHFAIESIQWGVWVFCFLILLIIFSSLNIPIWFFIASISGVSKLAVKDKVSFRICESRTVYVAYSFSTIFQNVKIIFAHSLRWPTACSLLISVYLMRVSVFLFVLRVFIIACSNSFIMAALKFLLGNSKFYVISLSTSVDCLFSCELRFLRVFID